MTITKRPGEPWVDGTKEAKRRAAAVLEVLSGLRTPAEAGPAMGVSVTRYYALETRALQGMVSALELREGHHAPNPMVQIAELQKDKQRLERELKRSMALFRAAQRAMGLVAPSPVQGKKGEDGRKHRKPRVRSRRFVKALRKSLEEGAPTAPPAKSTPTTSTDHKS